MSLRKAVEDEQFSYNQLMLYGVHIGHSFYNSVFYTSWLVYTYSQKILILNLYKSLIGMRSGLASISGAVGAYQPTWFINLDQAAGIPVRFLSLSCGEFSATSFWINGFISNFLSVYNTYRKLRKMSWFSYPTRNKNAIDSYNLWYLTRSTWPRNIFISNVCFSYQPAKESLHLGIPCLGIVDSNTYTHVVSVPIPGNDDSFACLVFYNDFISKFILSRKFALVISWYYNVRRKSRLLSFKDWFIKKEIYKENNNKSFFFNKKNFIKNLKFRFNFIKNIQLGMNTLFSINIKHKKKNFEYLDVYLDQQVDQSNKLSDRDWKKNVKLYLLNIEPFIKYLRSLFINRDLWGAYKFVRRRFFKGKYFRTNLLTHNYFDTNIKIDRFYKTHYRWCWLKTPAALIYYKFFVIYNFARFKQLSKYFIPKNIFGSVIYKLVWEQINPKSHSFNVNIKNKIHIKKELWSSYPIKNLYKLYNKDHKVFIKNSLFQLINKKKWVYLNLKDRLYFLNELKLYKCVTKFKIHNLNFYSYKNYYKFKNFIKNFIKKYTNKLPGALIFFFQKTLDNICELMDIDYDWLENAKSNNHRYYYRTYKKTLYNKKKWTIRSAIHQLKRDKHNIYKLPDTKLFRKRLPYMEPEDYKAYMKAKSDAITKAKVIAEATQARIKFRALNKDNYTLPLIITNNKSISNDINIISNPKLIFNNIKKLIDINFIKHNNINYICNYTNINNNKIKYLYKIKRTKNYINFIKHIEYDLNYLDFISFFKLTAIDDNTLHLKKKFIYRILIIYFKNLPTNIWLISKGFLFYFYNLFFNNISYNIPIAFNTFIAHYLYTLHSSFFSRRSKLIWIALINRSNYWNNTNYNKFKTNITTNTKVKRLGSFSYFVNTKYLYYIYLSKNPFKLNTTAYWNYSAYTNFISWNKTVLYYTRSWKFFIDNSNTTLKNFFRDLYLNHKYKGNKVIINNYSINNNTIKKSIKIINTSNRLSNNFKYGLGWFTFPKNISYRDWFFEKKFFTFPIWFYTLKSKILDYTNIFRYKVHLHSFLDLIKFESGCMPIVGDTVVDNPIFTEDQINIYFLCARVYFEDDLSLKAKFWLLRFLRFKLIRSLPLEIKEAILDYIRYDRRISWSIKQKLLTNLGRFIDWTIPSGQKYMLYKKIWFTRHYTRELRDKKLLERIASFYIWKKKRSKFLKVCEHVFYKHRNMLFRHIFAPKKIIPAAVLEQELTDKNNRKLIFRLGYDYPSLKNSDHQKNRLFSPLNKLFLKFYNIPIIKGDPRLNNYLNNFKIKLWNRRKRLPKQRRCRRTNKRLFYNKYSKIYYNPSDNYNSKVHVRNFIKMYGYKWV